jgi:hypothetical protein
MLPTFFYVKISTEAVINVNQQYVTCSQTVKMSSQEIENVSVSMTAVMLDALTLKLTSTLAS